MITSLTIENKASDKWYLKIINFIAGDKISTEIKVTDGVVLKNIYYINRKDRIDWELISDTASLQKKSLLCTEDIPLNGQFGLRRYKSTALYKRLCINTALAVINSLNPDDRCEISVFDANGEFSNSVVKMAKLRSGIRVITANMKKYESVSEQLLQEDGAAIFVSDNMTSLLKADFIIAPQRITKKLPVKSETVILTSCKSTAEQNGRIFCEYELDLPLPLAKIKPKELTNAYFASSLYDKCGKNQLGNITPIAVTDGCTVHTPLSFAKSLCRNS